MEASALPTLHEIEPFPKPTAPKTKFVVYVAVFMSSLHVPQEGLIPFSLLLEMLLVQHIPRRYTLNQNPHLLLS